MRVDYPTHQNAPLLTPLLLLLLASAGCVGYVIWGPPLMVRLAQHVPNWSYLPLLSAVHVLAFVAWTPPWVLLMRRQTGRRWPWAALGLPILAAVVSEVAQAWIPRHDPDLRGGLSSLAGVALGFGVMSLFSNGAQPSQN